MSVDAAQLPPQPRPDPDSEGFWSATASGRIELCRCRDCGLWHHPPLERCRACAAETRFDPIAGTGSLRSFIVVRHAAVPGYLDAVPYIVGMVELDEQPGLRLVGRLLDVDPQHVEVGARVRAELVDLPPGDFVVIAFRIGEGKPDE